MRIIDESLILEDRQVRKTIGTYILALPDFDNRMRTTHFPALETGRSSTSQQSPPIRPYVEVIDENGKKKKKSLGMAFQTLSKHGEFGDIRAMFVPNSNHIFVNVDSSQAEARVVFKLANDEQALIDIDTHDYHSLTASWFFGGTELSYSKKILGYEHPIRFAGKTLRHACHLGAAKRRAAIEVNTQARKYKINIKIDESIADKAIRIFHQKQPKIQQIFHTSVIECLKRDRVLIAPIPYGINSRYGGRRTFYERYDDELFRQAFSYLPQRAVSDNTKAAGMRIKQQFRSCKIVLESHDALLFMIRENELDDFVPIVKNEFERPIRFETCSIARSDLIIPCEIEWGTNYLELKKLKFHDEPLLKVVNESPRSFSVE
jgi:hypothetical protein